MKVSVVCPTFGREEYGPLLYANFESQTYTDRELIVYDDSPSPSAFFSQLKDPQVRYIHNVARATVGTKRNWLAQESTGELIAHFDDDDYYAPNYLEQMVANLGEADLVKLSGFYIFSITNRNFAYWDLNHAAKIHFHLESGRAIDILRVDAMTAAQRELWQLKNLLGYGFSCVYRKDLWESVHFLDQAHGEDFHFVEAVMQAGAKVRLPVDRNGLAVVLRHTNDSSIVYPQYLLPPHLLQNIFGNRATIFLEKMLEINANARPPSAANI
jgi:glycosyltransferase involved in cell wall biosynthesis